MSKKGRKAIDTNGIDRFFDYFFSEPYTAYDFRELWVMENRDLKEIDAVRMNKETHRKKGIRLENYIKRYKDNLFSEEAEAAMNDFLRERKNRNMKPVVVWESDVLYKERMSKPKQLRECWAIKYPFGDSDYILKSDIKYISSKYGLTSKEYIELIEQLGLKYYRSYEFEYEEPRFHLFPSGNDASRWIYIQMNKGSDGLSKVKDEGESRRIIRSNVYRCASGKKNHINGYVVRYLFK